MHPDLPPLAPDDALSRCGTVCATVRLYLAVWDDLTSGQIRLISMHTQICEQCAHEQQLFQRVTGSITCLPKTQPLAHVDRAVLAAIATRSQANTYPGESLHRNGQFPSALRSFCKNQTMTSCHFPRLVYGTVPQAVRYLWRSLCLRFRIERILSSLAMFLHQKARR